jgi:hypothetical protein
MKLLRLPLVLVWVCSAQEPTAPPHGSEQTMIPTPHVNTDPAFPQRGTGSEPPDSGPDLNITRSQRNALIKADHKRNLEDAAALLKLAEDLRSDLEKEDAFVISVKNIKQTEDIQKLVKSIHGRLKRY